jgi:hypothetical protein
VEKPNAKKFEMDFASDDKDTKKTARVMLQMVAAINHDYISKLPPAQTPPFQVQCVTCHHGSTQPRQLTSVLAEAIDQKRHRLCRRALPRTAPKVLVWLPTSNTSQSPT